MTPFLYNNYRTVTKVAPYFQTPNYFRRISNSIFITGNYSKEKNTSPPQSLIIVCSVFARDIPVGVFFAVVIAVFLILVVIVLIIVILAG